MGVLAGVESMCVTLRPHKREWNFHVANLLFILSIRNWEEDVLFLSMNIGFLKYVESVFSLLI